MSQSLKSAIFSAPSRLALVAMLGATVSGCSSDFTRLSEGPGYTGATANQQAILSGQQASQPYPGDVTGSVPVQQPAVQQSALPPMQPYPQAAPQSTYQAPLYPAASPQPVLHQPVAAPSGWTAAGGTYVTMMPGETVDTLARKYSVPVNAILSVNNWASPTQALPGSRVLIPSYNAQLQQQPAPAIPRVAQPQKPQAPFAQASRPALVPLAPPPVAAAKQQPVKVASVAPQPVLVPAPAPAVAKAAPAPQAQPGVVIGPHVVKKGESLDVIAKTYGTTKAKLMAANGLKSETIIIGQKLVLPSGVMLKVAQKDVAPAPAVAAKAPVLQQPAPMVAKAPGAPVVQPQQVAVAPVAVQPAPVAAQPQPAKESIAVAQEPPPAVESPRVDKSPAFRWPVRGRIIKEFGSKAGNDRNDGVNLAVPEGTSVKAAEDGEVIYSSNGLKEYGNLVLVKHSDGWVTAYGNASELLVNKGDKVTRGQIIARAGQTGSVDQPQLHFELRKGQKPVDPTQYLSN